MLVLLDTLIAAVSLILTALTFFRRNERQGRIEYIVETRTTLVPASIAGAVTVSHDGSPVDDPALTVVRIVNTGNTTIERADFDSRGITLALPGAVDVAHASMVPIASSGPNPEVHWQDNEIKVGACVMNPGDTIALQVITAGVPDDVVATAHISRAIAIARREVPHSLGSGSDGRMNISDRFLVYFYIPAAPIIAAIAIPATLQLTSTARLISAGLAMIFLAVYARALRQLRSRRRLWHHAQP